MWGTVGAAGALVSPGRTAAFRGVCPSPAVASHVPREVSVPVITGSG